MSRIRVFMEMRPALDGHFGIPQENRLLFAALANLPQVELSGLLQSSVKYLEQGATQDPANERHMPECERSYQMSRVVVSIAGDRPFNATGKARTFVKQAAGYLILQLSSLVGWPVLKLGYFSTSQFPEFTWETLFSKSVPAEQREAVLARDYRVLRFPWKAMHHSALHGQRVPSKPRYPVVDMSDASIFIAQTPYPARLRKGTAMIVRYHDAIPILMPHTISDRSFHQTSHYSALAANVQGGAWFACVSEATRQDLIKLFPSAEPRTVTIHNMVSEFYFPTDNGWGRVPDIIMSRQRASMPPKFSGASFSLAKKFESQSEKQVFFENLFAGSKKYLLAVSTIEPRKNHLRLISAWLALRNEADPDLKLVLVGNVGWDFEPVLEVLTPWIDRGAAFVLSGVPAEELRILYRHAAATVCPSVGEGFDYSGVESMRCGGAVAASDIPVHREIYGHAAVYFDPYSTVDMSGQLGRLLYGEAAEALQSELREKGMDLSKRYLPGSILPQWRSFIERVAAGDTA